MKDMLRYKSRMQGADRVMKILLEAVVYSLIYSVFMLILFQKQGAKYQLYNYPPAIRERAIEKGIITQEELNHNAKSNKTIGLIVMIVLSILITCVINKQFTFFAGFIQSYIFFNAFSLVDSLIIDTIWFCHSKWWVIPGTEDMTDAYHDYAFHWKWFFIGLVSSAVLSAITGGIIALIGLAV